MKKFWIVFVIVAVVIGGGLGLAWRAVHSLEESVSIDGGVLVWKVSGDYPEERDTSFWGQVQSSGDMTVRDVVGGLRRGARDDRITGLVLDLVDLHADWAKIEEIRDAIGEFHAAEKPVIAYTDGVRMGDYALASMADEIVISPEATIMVLGLAAELSFMKDTLGKLGMEADFIHVGKFKSAPERMTRTEPSEANREMIESIVEDRYTQVLNMVADGRGRTTEEVAGWIDRGMFDAQAAIAEGLADTLLYYDQMMDLRFPEDKITYLSDYVLDAGGKRRATHEVGVVYITGVIMPGESRFDRFQGKIAGSETVIDDLMHMREDTDIDAVILRVDSPGGSALASDLIWHEIREVQQEKPVIVSMSGMAASGGYYVSCLADSIFADAGTLTGSIGVYAGKMSRTAMYEKVGVHREFITRGRNALLFSDEGRFTAEQRELFGDQLLNFYERFLRKVADGRALTRDAVHDIAQGRVWTGSQGVERGLVDEVGGFYRALDSAKWMIGLTPADKVRVVYVTQEMSFVERLVLRSLRDGGGMGRLAARWTGLDPLQQLGPLPTLAAALRDDGTMATVELMDGRPVAMAPFWLQIR